MHHKEKHLVQIMQLVIIMMDFKIYIACEVYVAPGQNEEYFHIFAQCKMPCLLSKCHVNMTHPQILAALYHILHQIWNFNYQSYRRMTNSWKCFIWWCHASCKTINAQLHGSKWVPPLISEHYRWSLKEIQMATHSMYIVYSFHSGG